MLKEAEIQTNGENTPSEESEDRQTAFMMKKVNNADFSSPRADDELEERPQLLSQISRKSRVSKRSTKVLLAILRKNLGFIF